ncbi:hypothetical protein L198_00936 [Cryptococcus wingfieldii CBS 7118]|uniref:Uncharacterized protein n=1 Tax=Cryptococcus wingfieldii CBS 7118 TaxID=1295528 RepID=A0A1E3K487_9TREE|nr:hypothetical protein L198_00936 [Cryptococcus wingfieldii CBS 7118]ODO07357.1 hypothetical protein L198_00936 [Cryptococcus wingfieldii CBS 7118]
MNALSKSKGKPHELHPKYTPSISFQSVPAESATLQQAQQAGEGFKSKLFGSFPRGEVTVRKNDSILLDILGKLGLNPNVLFSPADWASFQYYDTKFCGPKLTLSDHANPIALHTHLGLMRYFDNTMLHPLNMSIGDKEALWSSAMKSCHGLLGRSRGEDGKR